MLEAIDLHKAYNNGKKTLPVLKGINLKIKAAEFAGIVGPSGAGKSTLLHILGGLDSPDQGKVIFQQEDLYALNDKAISGVRNRRIGFVFQFYHLLAEFNVLENVMMPALINSKLKTQNSKLNAEVVLLLEKVGLADRATHFPSQLSGGEKQRVAIARALLNKPHLLLCDEPTGNLDSATGKEIISLIKKVNQENKMAVVVVTHNAELAGLTDRVFQLRDGMLVN
jgi:ABC-type lipoprotein export system ATPase subunit